MSAKSEDIRLSINHVRHKKSDGTLYLMAERLAWMPDNEKNLFTISHKYSDIKTQKISSEAKVKIQLQVVLHSGEATTFQFQSIEDRTVVKDALYQILLKYENKVPREREMKVALMEKNPSLAELYKELVETKILSEEEFWNQFVDDKLNSASEIHDEMQDVGVSADFMSGIPLNGKQVKCSVTVETLWAILKTYPKVAQKHKELVPSKMTESEFWNKFFQSRYFHRDRTRDGLFNECAKSDEKEWSASLKKSINDPFLNLDMFDDNAHNNSKPDQATPHSDKDNPNSLLLKRFNQHSIRLLETLTKDTNAAQSSLSSSSQQQAQINKQRDGNEQAVQVNEQQQQQQESSFKNHRRDVTYEDLAGQKIHNDFLVDHMESGSRSLQVDKDKYSIMPQIQSQVLTEQILQNHISCFESWQPNLQNCISSQDALDAVKDLSPGGSLMQSSTINRIDDLLSSEVKEKIRSLYYGSNELLRHFWMCFPIVDKKLEEKLIKIYETMNKFLETRFQPFHDSLPRDQRQFLNHMLRSQFKTAQTRFMTWKAKSIS